MTKATHIDPTHPIVRAAAEGMAREFYRDASAHGDAFCAPPPFDYERTGGFHAECRTHARLLVDMTRPASRDWWARWLAGRVGLKVGFTAPEWVLARNHHPRFWTLRCSKFQSWRFESALTDPAKALTAAVLAALAGGGE